MLHTNLNSGGTSSACPCLAGELRRPRGYPAVAFALLVCLVAVFSAVAQPAPGSNRFLFIIDTSAGMKPFDKGLRETVFDLMYSGVRGRMTNGDTYGIWLLSDQNDTSFPMQVWKSREGVETGARATMLLKDRAYKGRARLDLAMADVLNVVKNVEDLTVIIISNGETPIQGTPFDAEINARFRELAPRMKRAKATLNTALVAQGGTLVAWAANAPDYLLDVPYVAPRPKPVAAARTNAPVENTNTGPKVQVTTTSPIAPVAKPPVEKPRVAAAPIVITKETVAQERLSYQAMNKATANEEATDVLATNTIVEAAVPATNPVATVASNPPVSTVSNALSRTGISSAPVVAPRTNAATNAVVAVAQKGTATTQTIASMTPPSGALPVSPTSTPATAAKEMHPLLWAVFGAAAAVFGMLAVFFVVRSRRSEPSLISQAIVQEKFSGR